MHHEHVARASAYLRIDAPDPGSVSASGVADQFRRLEQDDRRLQRQESQDLGFAAGTDHRHQAGVLRTLDATTQFAGRERVAGVVQHHSVSAGIDQRLGDHLSDARPEVVDVHALREDEDVGCCVSYTGDESGRDGEDDGNAVPRAGLL